MPIVLHDTDRAEATGSGKTITANRPTSMVDGEMWQVKISTRDADTAERLTSANITPPAGFSLVGEEWMGLAGRSQIFVYANPNVTSPPASVDFVIDGGFAYTPENWSTVSDRISGAANAAFHQVATAQTDGSVADNFNAPQVTTTEDGCLIGNVWGYNGGTGIGNFTIDPALSQTFHVRLTTPTVQLLGGYEDQATAGQTSVRNAGNTVAQTDHWAAITVALAPAPDDRTFSSWTELVSGAVLSGTRIFSDWTSLVSGSIGDRLFSPWSVLVSGSIPTPEGDWTSVFSTDFSEQATGINPIGFTPRLATNNQTVVVESDISMTGGAFCRFTTTSGTFDRLWSMDNLDGRPNTRQLILAQATSVENSPWALKFRSTGTTGTGSQDATRREYAITLVVTTENEMRLHRNDPNGNPPHVHLVTATSEFVTGMGDDTPTITSDAAFTALTEGDFFWLEAWIVNNEINYKFWRVGDPEPTEPGPGWIQHVDEQDAKIWVGDWNGIAHRAQNRNTIFVDTAEGFTFTGVLPELPPAADVKVTEATENTISLGWKLVIPGLAFRWMYQLEADSPTLDPFLLAGETAVDATEFDIGALHRATSWRIRGIAFDPDTGEESEPVDIIQATTGEASRSAAISGIGRVFASTDRRRSATITGVGSISATGVEDIPPFALRFWLDNFDDTDETEISTHVSDSGHNYTVIQQFPPDGRIEILGNRAVSVESDAVTARADLTAPVDEYDIYFTLRHFSLIPGGSAGIVARATGATWPLDQYIFAYEHDSEQWVIADADGALVSLPEILPAGAYQCRAEVRNTVKRLWVLDGADWQLKLETEDNTHTTGSVGIFARGVMGAATGTHIQSAEARILAFPIELHTAPTGQNYTLESGEIFIFPDDDKAFSTSTEQGVATIHPQPPTNEYDIQFEVDRQSSISSGQFGVVFRAQPGFSEGYSAFYDDDGGFWDLQLNGSSLTSFEESLSTGTILGRAFVSTQTKELAIEELGSWVTKLSSSNNSILDGTIGILLRGVMDPTSGSHIDIASAETVGGDEPVFVTANLANPSQLFEATIAAQDFVEISSALTNPSQTFAADVNIEDPAEIRWEGINPSQTFAATLAVQVSSDVIFNLTNPRQSVALTVTNIRPDPWKDDSHSNTTGRNASRFIWRSPVIEDDGGVDFIPAVASASPWIITDIDPIVLTQNPTEDP